MKPQPSSHLIYTVPLIISLTLSCTFALAGPLTNDPQGFYGIKWGHSLIESPQLTKFDSQKSLDYYRPRDLAPSIWGIPVTSIKLLSINDQFARITIHYRGEKAHQALLNELESKFGEITHPPGSMMRGLNQEYSWRGSSTEISITYQGLSERGFLAAQSRILAAEVMNTISDQSF